MRAQFRSNKLPVIAAILFVAGFLLTSVAAAEPAPGTKKRGFRLFARALGAMTVNRIYCGLASDGQICVDSTNSSTIGGGFWPKGTADQYVFNSGLQLAGIIGPDGGAWAGDTTGAFFFDPKGTTQHGEQVQQIYNAQNAGDLGSWPDEGCVPNGDATANLYQTVLQTDPSNLSNPNCRKSASQGDVYWLSWEGNPSLNAGRKHPLGVLVETRGLGWNFPVGNEDILYFVYTFYNVTSTVAGDYAAVRPALRSILQTKATEFQALNNARFGVTLPAGGYTITNLFAAFAADMDVAEAGANYSSVNLPFALGYVYENKFDQPAGWTFDPGIFGQPGLFAGSGFIGVKYLSGPTGKGEIQLFSNTVNGSPYPGAFNDPQNTTQLFRYLSGAVSVPSGDQPCNTGNQALTRICNVNNNSPQDMRFFQSSTALSLAPGAGRSIVVAYIFAAPALSGQCPGVACDVQPGDPTLTNSISALTGAGVNPIDTLTGFAGYLSTGDTAAVQSHFIAKPGSLLGKALTAQAIFDNQFLLPSAPDSPDFFLVPGDNSVAVLWRPSTSETSGDTYWNVANSALRLGNPNVLYDPNYRQFDVEGYRVYRGRVDAPNELTLLAQFDYSDADQANRGLTTFPDYTGQVNADNFCAPEFGINTQVLSIFDVDDNGALDDVIGGCPINGQLPNLKDGTTLTLANEWSLDGPVVQSLIGKRVLSSGDTSVTIIAADTALTGGALRGPCAPSRCEELSGTGVPFVFLDNSVRNNIRYFYSVTAFDINSLNSGPSSLESNRRTKSITPVFPASNYDNQGATVSGVFGRGVKQDSVFPAEPTIDAATGQFSGPFPPADGAKIGFVGGLVKQLVTTAGEISLTLDSIGAGSAYDFVPVTYYVTLVTGQGTSQVAIPLQQDRFNGTASNVGLFDAVPIDAPLAARYGADTNYKALKGQAEFILTGNYYTNAYGRGCINSAPLFASGGGCNYNGPRWFAGPSPQNNETKVHPVSGNGANGSNTVNAGAPNNAGFNNAGELPGVDVIYQPYSYQTTANVWRNVEGVLGSFKRAADYNVYWNATTAGLVDSVIDVTHNVPVLFDSLKAGTGFGILTSTLASPSGTGVSFDRRPAVSVQDFGCVEPFRSFPANNAQMGCGPTSGADGPNYYLTRQAALDTVAFFTTSASAVRTSINTGTGFAMYMPGNLFLMQMTTLPVNTVWSLRDYVGGIVGGVGFGGDNGPYKYRSSRSGDVAVRPFTAAGATVKIRYDVTNQLLAPKSSDLTRVHTVPDPYYITNAFEASTDNKVIKFVNLPDKAIIRIYSSSGILVRVLEHSTTTFSGEQTWDVRNRNNQVVASGVYFYHIEANSARRVGRFTVVNYAQ